jgi:hypothetical protein
MPKADYTLAYLRYCTGQRPTEPDATVYGKDDRKAAMIRAEVERAVALGQKIAPNVVKGPTVIVLVDADGKPKPGAKTHALDCTMFPTFHWARGTYAHVAASAIPPRQSKCGFCGGGRA